MVTIRTDLANLRESARRLRFEQTGDITDTDVQDAIATLDTNKATKVGTIRKPASSATIAILTTDIEVGIDTRSTAVAATLPSAVAWAATNPNGLELVLVDYFGNAATHNITPSAAGGDSIEYGGVTPIINSNFGVLKLRPDPALPGWYVRGLN